MHRDRIDRQLALSHAVLEAIDPSAVARAAGLLAERRGDATVFVIGNGGSASTASHFATDLGKNTVAEGLPRFRVVALTDNAGTITAYANDMDVTRIFAEPLMALARPGDILVAISASGNSPNIVAALEVARAIGMTIIGLTGFDGGVVRARADIALHVPVDSYELAEDAHLLMCHLLVVCQKATYTPPTVRVAAA
ncbi:MAG: SIS domain-containing protein [Dehalococcoidia bacterium]|nr:SIS domain-containing protein [Dehalococcoidia bacterium]